MNNFKRESRHVEAGEPEWRGRNFMIGTTKDTERAKKRELGEG